MATPFETLLQAMPRNRFRAALIDVADAAYACETWFKDRSVNPTAGDLVAMTRLVLEREELLIIKEMQGIGE